MSVLNHRLSIPYMNFNDRILYNKAKSLKIDQPQNTKVKKMMT